MGKTIVQKVETLVDMERTYLPFDTEDNTRLHSDDNEEVSQIIKNMGKNKKKGDPK